jgi:hypothetical protein
MNDSSPDDSVNVRCDRYLIARSRAICPRCGAETRVVALMMPPRHETRSGNEERDSWDGTESHAFLFYVESLPDAVRQRMKALAPMYRFAASPAAQCSYWANHCDRCGGIQEDHDLFCEPEGAFLPISPEAASIIELFPMDETLEAAAAGHAMDPAFIEFMLRV